MDDKQCDELRKKVSGESKDMLEAVKSLYIEASELKSKGVDVSEQLKILVKTDVLLSGTNPSNISQSRANLATVFGDLCFKKKTLAQSKSIRGGIGVLIFLTVVTGIFFAIVVPISIFVPDVPQSQSDDGSPIGMINTSLDFQIILAPAYVYVWGIMGTLSYLLWACVTHIANKDFDNYYVPWFVLRIPLGAIMAAAIYFVVVSGFVTLGDKIEVESNIPFIVLAFISGFSIRYSMNTLDRVTNAIMPNKQDVKTNITEPPKEVT